MKVSTLAVAFTFGLVAVTPAFADGKACELVTPEELAGVMGGKPALKPSVLPNGVEVCTGKASGTTVTLRLFAKTADLEEYREKADVDKLKKMGATVEARKISGVNCTAVGPGGTAARQPYTTSCTVSNKQRHAVIELSNPSLEIAMKDLAPIADRIGSRFWQL
jgi:hypothetical protein